MLRYRIDARNLEARVRAMEARRAEARDEALKVGATGVMRFMQRESPRDTNRYVRAWAQAANAAGLGPFPVPAVQQATRHEQILVKLVNQRNWWGYIVQRYERQDRRDRWYNQAVRKLRACERELERFAKTDAGAVIAIGLYNTHGNWTDAQGNFRKGKLTTIRYKIYGGTGRLQRMGDRSFYVLHNMEAHASLVEAWSHTLQRAMAEFRGTGLKKGGRAYLEKIRAQENRRRVLGTGGGWGGF